MQFSECAVLGNLNYRPFKMAHYLCKGNRDGAVVRALSSGHQCDMYVARVEFVVGSRPSLLVDRP